MLAMTVGCSGKQFQDNYAAFAGHTQPLQVVDCPKCPSQACELPEPCDTCPAPPGTGTYAGQVVCGGMIVWHGEATNLEPVGALTEEPPPISAPLPGFSFTDLEDGMSVTFRNCYGIFVDVDLILEEG